MFRKSDHAQILIYMYVRSTEHPCIGSCSHACWIWDPHGKHACSVYLSRELYCMTPPILKQLRAVLEKERSKYDSVMLWAACCTCFFGFLLSGEVMVPTASSYDPWAHLSFGDVTVDTPDAPTSALINIKTSKTDPFRKGISIYVGKTGNDLCPVTALTTYLTVRGGGPGPIFRMKDGKPLTRVPIRISN